MGTFDTMTFFLEQNTIVLWHILGTRIRY